MAARSWCTIRGPIPRNRPTIISRKPIADSYTPAPDRRRGRGLSPCHGPFGHAYLTIRSHHEKTEPHTPVTSGLLKNVGEAAEARQKQAKKRSLRAVNEHFEPVFNAVSATQVVFQRPAKGRARRLRLAGAGSTSHECAGTVAPARWWDCPAAPTWLPEYRRGFFAACWPACA